MHHADQRPLSPKHLCHAMTPYPRSCIYRIRDSCQSRRKTVVRPPAVPSLDAHLHGHDGENDAFRNTRLVLLQIQLPPPTLINVMQQTPTNLIAINVGNSRTQLARFEDGELKAAERFANVDSASIIEGAVGWWKMIADQPHAAIVLASVNDPVASALASGIEDQLSIEVYRVGEDMPVPIGQQLDPETLTGIDRLLNAAAAFDRVKQACVVVDVGTAVTVDFVDGEGTFHGGAIAPGTRLQLRSLHENTATLPELDFRTPDDETFGRNTAEAMLRGVYHGIRGMVWKLTEHYAERYGAYPTIIVTGGDAEALFKDDELIDRIVPDLTLFGIEVAARHALSGNIDEDADLRS